MKTRSLWSSSRQKHLPDVVLSFFDTSLQILLLLLQFFDFLVGRFLFVHQLVIDLLLRLKNEHASDSLVEPGVVWKRADLEVSEPCVFVNSAQLLDLEVGHLGLLLRVQDLYLQL